MDPLRHTQLHLAQTGSAFVDVRRFGLMSCTFSPEDLESAGEHVALLSRAQELGVLCLPLLGKSLSQFEEHFNTH